MLVLKKLGDELFQEFLEVVNYLGKVEGMRIIVEPQDFEALVSNLNPLTPYIYRSSLDCSQPERFCTCAHPAACRLTDKMRAIADWLPRKGLRGYLRGGRCPQVPPPHVL